jgi:hypothetical protein
MSESLLEQLPKIVAEEKKEVERIRERISSPHKLTLRQMSLCCLVKTNQVFSRGTF